MILLILLATFVVWGIIEIKNASTIDDELLTPVEPDYKGFGEHVAEWEEKGLPYGTKELIELAKHYGTPIPKIINGEIVFEEENKKEN